MNSIRFDDYAKRYDCVSMRREDGILELTIHAKGAPYQPCLWSNAPHEESSFAFYDIARDRENCADMHPSIAGLSRFSEGKLTADMCEKMDQTGHDGRHLVSNLLNIEVPMIAAVALTQMLKQMMLEGLGLGIALRPSQCSAESESRISPQPEDGSQRMEDCS